MEIDFINGDDSLTINLDSMEAVKALIGSLQDYVKVVEGLEDD